MVIARAVALLLRQARRRGVIKGRRFGRGRSRGQRSGPCPPTQAAIICPCCCSLPQECGVRLPTRDGSHLDLVLL